MSNPPPNGYIVRLVYYGRADFMKYVLGHKDEGGKWVNSHQEAEPLPRVSTQNIRIVAFPQGAETTDYIGIYELVKNTGAKE